MRSGDFAGGLVVGFVPKGVRLVMWIWTHSNLQEKTILT